MAYIGISQFTATIRAEQDARDRKDPRNRFKKPNKANPPEAIVRRPMLQSDCPITRAGYEMMTFLAFGLGRLINRQVPHSPLRRQEALKTTETVQKQVADPAIRCLMPADLQVIVVAYSASDFEAPWKELGLSSLTNVGVHKLANQKQPLRERMTNVAKDLATTSSKPKLCVVLSHDPFFELVCAIAKEAVEEGFKVFMLKADNTIQELLTKPIVDRLRKTAAYRACPNIDFETIIFSPGRFALARSMSLGWIDYAFVTIVDDLTKIRTCSDALLLRMCIVTRQVAALATINPNVSQMQIPQLDGLELDLGSLADSLDSRIELMEPNARITIIPPKGHLVRVIYWNRDVYGYRFCLNLPNLTPGLAIESSYEIISGIEGSHDYGPQIRWTLHSIVEGTRTFIGTRTRSLRELLARSSGVEVEIINQRKDLEPLVTKALKQPLDTKIALFQNGESVATGLLKISNSNHRKTACMGVWKNGTLSWLNLGGDYFDNARLEGYGLYRLFLQGEAQHNGLIRLYQGELLARVPEGDGSEEEEREDGLDDEEKEDDLDEEEKEDDSDEMEMEDDSEAMGILLRSTLHGSQANQAAHFFIERAQFAQDECTEIGLISEISLAILAGVEYQVEVLKVGVTLGKFWPSDRNAVPRFCATELVTQLGHASPWSVTCDCSLTDFAGKTEKVDEHFSDLHFGVAANPDNFQSGAIYRYSQSLATNRKTQVYHISKLFENGNRVSIPLLEASAETQ